MVGLGLERIFLWRARARANTYPLNGGLARARARENTYPFIWRENISVEG